MPWAAGSQISCSRRASARRPPSSCTWSRGSGRRSPSSCWTRSICFPETYRFVDELTGRLGLNLKVYSIAPQPRVAGGALGQALGAGRRGHHALQRDQQGGADGPRPGRVRSFRLDHRPAPVAVVHAGGAANAGRLQDGRVKVHPIYDWSNKDVHQYLTRHELPYHPLWYEGYVSIGDVQTSRPMGADMTEEETRFFGLKRECGIHIGESI